MKTIGLIIRREFLTRVRKKTFIVLTILGPLLMGAILFLPAYLATLPQETKIITVLDEGLLLDFEKGNDEVRFRYLPAPEFDFDKAKAFAKEQGDYAFLHVPVTAGGDPDFLARNVVIMREGDLSIKTENYIERLLERYIQREKLKASGVDPEIVARTKTNVSLRVINTKDGAEAENATLVKMGVGYVAAFAIYIFIFIYGSQVMRGVIEEKTSRIVELMVSSVKPFQLMMGKIIGIGGVALLQFLIWVGLGSLFYFLGATFFLEPQLEAASLGAEMPEAPVFDILRALGTIDFTTVLLSFLFYFIGGYLLYSSLFAAIGSAVDKESDSQQFMLPVSLPLIASIIVILRALDNPDGPLAFWFSMVPLSSPLVMMARLPFGVPTWQLLLSMFLLIANFLFFTWLAAKIYRVGILMYGKKPSFKEIFRWIKYRS